MENHFMLSEAEPQSAHDFESAYSSALEEYLQGEGEACLQQAYEIGRAAITHELGVLDMAELHQRAMQSLLKEAEPREIDRSIKQAAIFFEESLSPFEITYRGYQDAIEIMRRVANFAFIACHEIKAPLTSILSCATLLNERLEPDGTSLEGRLIQNLLKSIETLKSRTDDMLDIAGLYSGSLSMHIRPVKLSDFLERVYEQLKPEVQWRGMRLRLRLARDLPEVEMDPERIQQVITNLVQNAVKYAAEGGWIELSARAMANQVVIRVADRGSGLPSHEKNLLLAQDRQEGRDRQARGTGLGLILCRQIVEAHGGRILLDSKANRGSALEIRLPRRGKPSGEGG